jgi:pilus assembly protein CpaE
MSASQPSSTSVLLPAATVAVFSPHDETRSAVAALATDWRFARIKFEIRQGDVNAAIASYTGVPSPNLLIVDTDVIDATFTSALDTLATTCSEGTDAIVVGPVNDVALYRYIIGIGVSDYLVRPLQPHIISDVIAATLIKQLGASDSQLIAVMGAKGGTGTSTVAELLAYGLAEVKGQKTAVLDAAGGRSYLAVAFGMEPITTMSETVRAAVSTDPNALARMLQKAGAQLQVLGTGNDRYFDESVAPEQLERVMDRIMAITPYVVVDLSGATIAVQRMVLSKAQRILLVSQPTLSSLRLARSLMNEMKELKGGSTDHIDLIINMIGMAPGAEVGKADIEGAIDHKINAMLPFDPKLVVGAEAQAKVLGSMRGSEKMINDLLASLQISGRGPDAPKGGGLFDNLLRKVGK